MRKSQHSWAKDERQCAPGECVCTIVIVGSIFTIYRCKECGKEEWL